MLKILGRRKTPVAQLREPACLPELLDTETGLAGPELFMDLLQRDIERSLRHGNEMTLMVFDVVIAGFKPTADEPEPPSVAKAVAAVLRDVARRSDIPARLGEFRFAVLLTSAEQPGAEQFSERVRTRIGTNPYARDLAGNAVHARAWAGATAWEPQYEDAAAYIAAAVQNMDETRSGYEHVQSWFKGND